MSFLDDTIKLVRDWDAARPRSTQAEVGWSEVGGCRAHMGYRLDGTWASDETDNWAATRGTAIHGLLEEILGSRPGIRTEITTSYRGIPGHADLIVDEDSVTDHKTTSLVNAKRWAEDHSLLKQKRIQVHGYAAGLVNDGVLPRDCTVRLLIIPVDGTFADWWAFEEKYDQFLADEGVARLEDVRDRMAGGETLPKDMPYQWCSTYCEFFSLCRAHDDPQAEEQITDPELVSAIAAYGEAVKAETAAKKVKEGLAPQLRGLRGTAGPWRIGMSKQGDPKEVPDEDAMAAVFEAQGLPVPMTTKPGRAASLSVRKLKGGRVSADTVVYGDVHNPADVENKIEETKNRIAAGVRIVTDREKAMKDKKRAFDLAWAYAIKNAEGPEYIRKSEAAITTMPHREEADNAEIAYKHAIRTADALERELFAWQSILNSVRAMYGAAGAR